MPWDFNCARHYFTTGLNQPAVNTEILRNHILAKILQYESQIGDMNMSTPLTHSLTQTTSIGVNFSVLVVQH